MRLELVAAHVHTDTLAYHDSACARVESRICECVAHIPREPVGIEVKVLISNVCQCDDCTLPWNVAYDREDETGGSEYPAQPPRVLLRDSSSRNGSPRLVDAVFIWARALV